MTLYSACRPRECANLVHFEKLADQRRSLDGYSDRAVRVGASEELLAATAAEMTSEVAPLVAPRVADRMAQTSTGRARMECGLASRAVQLTRNKRAEAHHGSRLKFRVAWSLKSAAASQARIAIRRDLRLPRSVELPSTGPHVRSPTAWLLLLCDLLAPLPLVGLSMEVLV